MYVYLASKDYYNGKSMRGMHSLVSWASGPR